MTPNKASNRPQNSFHSMLIGLFIRKCSFLKVFVMVESLKKPTQLAMPATSAKKRFSVYANTSIYATMQPRRSAMISTGCRQTAVSRIHISVRLQYQGYIQTCSQTCSLRIHISVFFFCMFGEFFIKRRHICGEKSFPTL